MCLTAIINAKPTTHITVTNQIARGEQHLFFSAAGRGVWHLALANQRTRFHFLKLVQALNFIVLVLCCTPVISCQTPLRFLSCFQACSAEFPHSEFQSLSLVHHLLQEKVLQDSLAP